MLPCIHSFCYGCLEEWVDKSGSKQTICCPLCKDVSLIPAGRLNRIKNNYFIADLVERLSEKNLKPSHREVKCTKEDIKLVEVYLIYCNIHARNVVDQYCVDYDLAACGTCLLRNHRQHNLVDLDEQAPISKQQLQAVLKQTDVLTKLIDDKINDNERHEKQLNSDINSTKCQINKVIDARISKLNNQRQQLFNTLDKIQEQKDKVLMTVHDGQEFSKAAVTSLKCTQITCCVTTEIMTLCSRRETFNHGLYQ